MNMQTILTPTAAEETLLARAAPESGAAIRLSEYGLPTRRVEAWHYTDLRNLLKNVPAKADKVDFEKAASLLSSYDRLTNSTRLPFVNGTYLSKASDETPNGVLVTDDQNQGSALLRNDDAIGLIDTLTGSHGLSIAIKDGVTLDRPIGLAQLVTSAVYCATSHNVSVGENAKASFIERHLSDRDVAGQTNAITNLSVEKGATVLWAIVQEHSDLFTHLGQLNVTMAENAKLTILVLNRGGKLVRQEINVQVNGEYSNLNILGVNLVGGGSHVDVTTSLAHNVANTTATETFRNVVTADGRGVFQGQIKVAQAAQKTDAQMACNTLLLSDQAEFSAKPELEIFADDVVCGHGATVTDIDDNQLFYMRARGISEHDARALLVKAFVDEIFDDLDDAVFREALIGLIDTWLDRNG